MSALLETGVLVDAGDCDLRDSKRNYFGMILAISEDFKVDFRLCLTSLLVSIFQCCLYVSVMSF